MDLAEKIKLITKEIQDQFTADNTPWVIGYSGGKDSTAVLQLVLYALWKLPKEKLTKEVHVLSSDTLVENPAIVSYIDLQLAQIKAVTRRKLFLHNEALFQVEKVVPKIEDRFWINLVGKGYPAPNRWFRWCTQRLKINPTNDYILQQVSRRLLIRGVMHQ
jgi:DNA sulfur modification protein DndC